MFAIIDPRSAGGRQSRAGDSDTAATGDTGTVDTPGAPAARDGGDDGARPAVDPADPAAPLTNRRVAQAYVASVCFKHGPPRLLGTELEWLVRDADRPARRLDPAVLRRALGPYAPPTLFPADAPAPDPTPLPSGGTVTVEPGGQVEIASPPMPSLASLLAAVEADATLIRERLATEGLVLLRRAGDPLRAPRRVLDVPRYAAMEAAFDRIGPHGRTMMCSTSAVQVCLDAGEGAQVARRWAALHELGPVLLGAFANSPAVHGRRTGWKSSRMATWLALDPERTRPPAVTGADPAAEYAERALATRLLCRRRATDGTGGGRSSTRSVRFGEWVDGDRVDGDEPTAADLAYHLTTLFPPVRPQGHLEVRYLDQQPGDEWMVPIAVVAALFADDATVDRARAAAAPAVGRWAAAARHGLDDRVLRRAAGEVFELAHRSLAAFPDLPPHARDLVEHAVDRVLRGRCPADEPVGEPGEDELGPPAASWVSMSPPDPQPAPHPDPVRGGAPS